MKKKILMPETVQRAMTNREFVSERKRLKKELVDFTTKIEKKNAVLVNRYLNDRSPVKENIVYELIEGGKKRRGFTRIIIYAIGIQMFGPNHPTIGAAGWWLDKDNVPTKWDNFVVAGVGNPAVFKQSKDQTYKPHPESVETKKKSRHRKLHPIA